MTLIEAETRKISTTCKDDANRDPITGAPGAHPVGVGAGATGGGVTGAVVGGVVAGPIGAGVGAVVGAIAGGLVGKGAAETVNPTIEHAYWRVEYAKRPYFVQGSNYEQYGPAYQYGWESYATHRKNGITFEAMEPQLRTDWESRKEHETLAWDNARNASRDAWMRLENGECGHCSM
jgi:hypothetical protein